jgi:hypothetical protein
VRVFRQLSIVTMLVAMQARPAEALPIGFGKNQGPVSYSEIKSDHFYIYHDARTPGEGAMMLNALEAARVPMERWFQESRKRPLPVVMSAISENASFANFIADAVELQTLGQGTRELAWHEYVHSTMYRKLDNILGPAGALIHLPWMPAWYLEGLAEALSVSVGSDTMAGIERYQALAGDWPTYPRLHSLYSKEGFAERGYATAGALTSYLFRKMDPNKLPDMLDQFYRYSMPWWWPWTMVPFNGFLPMDKVLENQIGMNGGQLYEAYKKDAKAHWEKTPGTFLVGRPDKRRQFTSIYGMKSNGTDILHLNRNDEGLQESSLTFDATTGWATALNKVAAIDDDFGSFSRVNDGRIQAGIKYQDEHAGEESTIRISFADNPRKLHLVKRAAIVIGMTAGPDRLYWTEFAQARSSFCSAGFSKDGKPECHLTVETPSKLKIVGERWTKDGLAEIWLSESTEKLTGTLTSLHVLNVQKRSLKKGVYRTLAGIRQVAFAGQDVWLFTSEHKNRLLRRMNSELTCAGTLSFKDHIVGAFGLADGSLVLGLYAGQNYQVKKLSPTEMTTSPCPPETAPTSPIQYAVQHPQIDFKTAFLAADTWSTAADKSEPLSQVVAAKPLNEAVQPGTGSETASSPARWRPRPLFLFPWIGADDALGPQIGVVSVPLMDHMQNETVRATFLYGAYSRYPYQEVAVTSTRFLPTLSFAAYRSQTYNGLFRNSEGGTVSSYLDEKGVRLESDSDFSALGGKGSFGAGFKYAHLKPYLGPFSVKRGFLAEPAVNFSLFHSFGRFSWSNSISGRAAPEALNETYDYNQIGAATNLGLSTGFLASKFTLGLEGSRTRGKEMRELKEVYRPLKTFIPGAGGGYNQNSFSLVGDDTGLFSPVFGDTQGRAKANWTFPVIREVDKLLWILYLERLDFTAFYNYGAAWNGPEPRRGWDKLIRAHGYSLDLQLENKGVRFNAGLGAGQVIGRDPEIYMTTGFDALF